MRCFVLIVFQSVVLRARILSVIFSPCILVLENSVLFHNAPCLEMHSYNGGTKDAPFGSLLRFFRGSLFRFAFFINFHIIILFVLIIR